MIFPENNPRLGRWGREASRDFAAVLVHFPKGASFFKAPGIDELSSISLAAHGTQRLEKLAIEKAPRRLGLYRPTENLRVCLISRCTIPFNLDYSIQLFSACQKQWKAERGGNEGKRWITRQQKLCFAASKHCSAIDISKSDSKGRNIGKELLVNHTL